MMTQSTHDVTRIRADELTQGDIIIHLDQTLEVFSEPEFTTSGIVFLVMPLDFNTEVYEVRFDPRWTFDLVGYNYEEAA